MSVRALGLFRIAAALVSVCATGSSAFAYSARVQSACRGDYFAHCSQFSVGTPELSQCMRRVGEGLSLPCLAALADDGQISKAEIDAYYARQQAKAGKGAATPAPAAVARAKVNQPTAKTAVVMKPGKNGKPVKVLVATQPGPNQPGPVTKKVVYSKNYDTPVAGEPGYKKVPGKKFAVEPRDAGPKVIAKADRRSIRDDDEYVARNAPRRVARDDDKDDGWYDWSDKKYFADRYRYASQYDRRDPDLPPPPPPPRYYQYDDDRW